MYKANDFQVAGGGTFGLHHLLMDEDSAGKFQPRSIVMAPSYVDGGPLKWLIEVDYNTLVFTFKARTLGLTSSRFVLLNCV